jgi:hypothetical protein
MTNNSKKPDSVEALRKLEYAIRQSMPVREDQEDPADPQHLDEAAACGIAITSAFSKGDLLSLVQTHIRAS